MRFVIPPHLLETLRARRVEKQPERALARGEAPIAQAPKPVPPRRGGFLSRLVAWLDAPKPADLSALAAHMADQFVSGMRDLQDEVEAQYDAFLLDPGMGPMTYLTTDGRVLHDMRTWDGADVVVVEDEDMAIAAIVAGVDKTGIEALYELLPLAPEGAATCPQCGGARLAKPVPEFPHEMICGVCGGRGWATDAMITRGREGGMRW